jgi:hypothetical protein
MRGAYMCQSVIEVSAHSVSLHSKRALHWSWAMTNNWLCSFTKTHKDNRSFHCKNKAWVFSIACRRNPADTNINYVKERIRLPLYRYTVTPLSLYMVVARPQSCFLSHSLLIIQVTCYEVSGDNALPFACASGNFKLVLTRKSPSFQWLEISHRLPSGFPSKTLHTFLYPLKRVKYPANLILLNLIELTS